MDNVVDDIIAINKLLAPYGCVSKKHEKEFVVGKSSDWFCTSVESKLGAGCTEFACTSKPFAFDLDYYQAAHLDKVYYDPNKRTVTNKVMVMIMAMEPVLVETWPAIPVNEFIENVRGVIEARKTPRRPAAKLFSLLPRAFKR